MGVSFLLSLFLGVSPELTFKYLRNSFLVFKKEFCEGTFTPQGGTEQNTGFLPFTGVRP